MVPLTETQHEEFVEQVDPLGDSDDFGYDKYTEAWQLLQNMIG